MDAKIKELEIKGDFRGSLIAIEENREIPFSIKRIYYIFKTGIDVTRGCHAHRNLEQVLIAVHGKCTIKLSDGKTEQFIKLDRPNKGLYINSMIWREMFDFSDDCVLVVLASQYYDKDDYVRDYNEFLNLVK